MNRELVQQIAERLCERNSGWLDLSFVDSGNSASVFRLDHPEYGEVALKVYDPSFFSGDNALIEEKRVRLQDELRSHGNKHLIEIFEVGPIPESATWYQIMEFCPWRNLEKQLTEISDDHIESLLLQLVDAVQFLASKGLVHRDIKPANIAVDLKSCHLKLLDLGVLRQIAHNEGNGTDFDEKRRFVATAQYSPPEYLTREEAPGEAGFKALNVYQVGAVLHDIIMKRPIFQEEAGTLNKYILYKAITTKRPLVFNSRVSPRLVALCKASLHKDWKSRIASIDLEDFRSKSDAPSAIRIRLAAGRAAKTRTQAPSIVIWETRVRDWIREAAVSEKEILGPHKLRGNPTADGTGWILSFRDHPGSIEIALKPAADLSHLVLSFSAQSPEPLKIDVLEIVEAGPQIELQEVREQIRNNIVYMLDLQGDRSEADQ